MHTNSLRRTALTLALSLALTIPTPCGAVLDAPEADAQTEQEILFVPDDETEQPEAPASDNLTDSEAAGLGGIAEGGNLYNPAGTAESESSTDPENTAPTDDIPFADSPEASGGTEGPDEADSSAEPDAPDVILPSDPLPEPGEPDSPIFDGGADPDQEQPSDDESESGEDSNNSEIPFEPEELPEAQSDELPVIEVTVPKNGHIIINPYGLAVDGEGEDSAEQIVSRPQQITNYSEVPVTVWASAKGTIADESSAVYVTEPPEEAGPDKEIFLYAEFQPDESSWQESYTESENQILITEHPTDPQPVLELSEDGEPDSEGFFRLFGELTTYPEDPWCEEDALEVVLTFTFLPAGADPEAAAEPDGEQSIDLYLEPVFEPEDESGNESVSEPENEPGFEPIFAPADEPQDILQDERLFGPVQESTPEFSPVPQPDSIREPDEAA